MYLPEHDLIIAETIILVQSEQSSYNQSITPDVHTDFSFFVSHATGIFYISMEPWIRKLENELSEPQTEGSDFRLNRVLEAASSSVEIHLERRVRGDPAEEDVTSAVVLEDGNIGYLLLTTRHYEPHAVLLDAPEEGLPTEEELAEYMAIAGPNKEVREAWQPPRELFEPFDILGSINIASRHRGSFKDEIKLSPANLEVLMDVHRVLSVQTSKLQHAVSDLFNRATRLQEEFRDQVYRTSQIASNIDNVTGNDETGSDDASTYGAAKIDERLEQVKTRQDQINARYEALRRKMASIGSSELSEKETGWIEELQTMDSAVDSSSRTLSEDVDGSEKPAWQRLNKVKELQKGLLKQFNETTKAAKKDREKEQVRSDGVKVPSQSRRLEHEQVQELMQRNSVLVEAAASRLRSLGVAIPVESES